MTKIAGVFARILFPLVLLVVMYSTCTAQTRPSLLWRAGGGIAPTVLAHTASFEALPGIPQPSAASVFSSSGLPVSLGIHGFVEVPVASWGSLGVLIDYRPSVPAAFTATELIPVQTESGLITATVSHTIDAQLQYWGLEGFAHFPLSDRLGVRGGVRFDFLGGSSFEQAQEITDPELDFVGFEGKVVSATGELPNAASTLISISGSLTYPIDLSDDWQLQLEGGARMSLNDVIAGSDWTMVAIQAGASFVYNNVAERQRLIDTVFQRDTTLRLVAGIAEERIQLVDSDATVQQTETPDAILSTVTLRQRYVRELPRPNALLTAGMTTHFVLNNGSEADEVSGEIRTVEEIRHVITSESMLYDGSVEGNPLFGLFSREFDEEQQHALGFTAKEMQQAALRHIRTKAGTRPGILISSRGSDDAAQEAASQVKKLCADAWQIPQDILTVQVRPAANRSTEPVADISIGSGHEPFVIRDTVVVLPMRKVLFYPEIVSEAGIQQWEMTIRWGNRELYSQKGEGDVPEVLSWTPNETILVAVPGVPIQCVLTVVDRSGQTQNTSGNIFFRHSKSGDAIGVDGSRVRFILHGRALDSKVIDYIQRHSKQAGTVPVSISCWYTAESPSEQPDYIPVKEARALGILPAHLSMQPQIVPGVDRQARRINNIIDIQTGIDSR